MCCLCGGLVYRLLNSASRQGALWKLTTQLRFRHWTEDVPTDGSTSADAQFGGADLDLNLADVDRLDTSVVNVADAMSPLI